MGLFYVFGAMAMRISLIAFGQSLVLRIAETIAETPQPTVPVSHVPPQQDLIWTNFMILLVVLAVVVIIIGVWLNRERENQ